MNKAQILLNLTQIADTCDRRGFFREADIVTQVLQRLAWDEDGDFGGSWERDDDYNVHEENELFRDQQLEREQEGQIHGFTPYDDYDTARIMADDTDESIGVNILLDRVNMFYFVVPDDRLDEFQSHFADGDLTVVDHLDAIDSIDLSD